MIACIIIHNQDNPMTEKHIEFTVDTPNERLDKLLVAHFPAYSRAQIQAWIKDGMVRVNDQHIKGGIKLRGGEHIHVTIPDQAPPPPLAADIPLVVIHDDPDFAVIDKPAGMVVHPGAGNPTNTLMNAICGRWSEVLMMQNERKGIVHRLDKETSGLIVIAKNDLTQRRLMRQFQARTVQKHYLALLERPPKTTIGRIEVPIGRDAKDRRKMTPQRDGRPAISEFEVLETFANGMCLVRFNLLTGRTHQIRVHAAFIGCPLVGDKTYGFRKQVIKTERMFLHAQRLAFAHPVSGQPLVFESPLPPALEKILKRLR